MAAWGSEAVEIANRASVGADTLGFPTAAFAGRRLPRRLIVRGPDGASRLVRATRVKGTARETVLHASNELVTAIAPGSGSEPMFKATIRRARLRDLYVYTPTRVLLAIAIVLLTFAAAVLGVAVAYLDASVPTGLVIALAAVLCLLAVLRLIEGLRGT